MKISAGILLYRPNSRKGIEVLLAHPSGNYNRHAPWSIPKGLPEEGESLEDAARRETLEETGVCAPRRLVNLGYIDYRKSAKRVFCYGGKALSRSRPHPSSWEVDRARFFPLETAMKLIHPDQRTFLKRLAEIV